MKLWWDEQPGRSPLFRLKPDPHPKSRKPLPIHTERRKPHLTLKPQSARKLVPNPLAARKNRVEAVWPQTYNRPPCNGHQVDIHCMQSYHSFYCTCFFCNTRSWVAAKFWILWHSGSNHEKKEMFKPLWKMYWPIPVLLFVACWVAWAT